MASTEIVVTWRASPAPSHTTGSVEKNQRSAESPPAETVRFSGRGTITRSPAAVIERLVQQCPERLGKRYGTLCVIEVEDRP
jgi:hypothetical protein